ncbi:MAG: DUF5320 domain-containing protein [Chloroflexota bacterium]
MPGFDGTGPRAAGPMTGRGEGYCALRLPEPGQPGYGYVGLRGIPVELRMPRPRPVRAAGVRGLHVTSPSGPPNVRRGRCRRAGR